VDVGAMWNVSGAYAFHALAEGASAVTAVDVMPPTAEVVQRNGSVGDRVRFIGGNIDDVATMNAIGSTDVVFCSGVLYHVPNPIHTLTILRAICAETLILSSATLGEFRTPNTAVFLPFLPDAARRRLAYRTRYAKVGLDTPVDVAASYANWFWGFSPSVVEAMCRTVGFGTVERHEYRHAVCFVLRPQS
jgi:SAM-dependent methyltransferase